VPFWCRFIPRKSPILPRSFTSTLPSRPEVSIYKVTAGSCAKRLTFWWTMPYPIEAC